MTPKEGLVVICGTGQAGTIIAHMQGEVQVLLLGGDIWRGLPAVCREPQDAEDLKAAIAMVVDRYTRRKP